MDDSHARQDDRIAEVLLEYVRTLSRANGADDILSALNDFSTRYLGVYGVGILVLDENGDLQYGTANTETGRSIEHAESELQEGPCTDAARRGTAVIVPDLEEVRETYPRFVPRALELGVRAVHALPIHHAGHLIGSLDIISEEPGQLEDEAVRTAQLLVEVAASYVANSRALAEKTTLAQQLQTALESRAVIEQAKGVVSAHQGIPVEEAFDRIRRYARSKQRKLKEVAGEIVRQELELPAE
ncbi:MAG: GAF and ANTAR domain-containing protein [Actinobacteria bacterium]|nr:GAF and ANTAR domain-containing protein [Actinomycetota bacterium]